MWGEGRGELREGLGIWKVVGAARAVKCEDVSQLSLLTSEYL